MVHARYCASYSKWPCVKHEANIWCPCGMISFCSRTFYSLLSSPMINVVTIPLDVTYVTVWLITSNPNPQVLKIEKWKINWKENKNEKENKKKLSPLSVILTLFTSYLFQLWLCLNYGHCYILCFIHICSDPQITPALSSTLPKLF